MIPPLLLAPLLLLALLPVATTTATAGAAAAGATEALAVVIDAGVAISDPAGSSATVVVPGAWSPAVSRDGTRLAWTQRGSDGRRHIFVGGLDGSGARQVTSGAADDWGPSWSPDGSRLALVRTGRLGAALAVVDADGTDGRIVPGSTAAGAPTWSPDSRFLGFARYRDVVAVALDGTNPTVLKRDTFGDSIRVDWSPEGDRLALNRHLTSDDSSVAVLDLTTGQEQQVASRFSYRYFLEDASWSQDGAHLWATQRADPGPYDGPIEYAVNRYDLQGNADRPLTGHSPSAGGGPRLLPRPRHGVPVGGLTATASASRVRLAWTGTGGSAGVTVRYAEGTTPPASVDAGLPGGDTLGTSLVVSRLAPSTSYAFSVFTRDWAGGSSPAATAEATTPAEVATTLSLTASATRVVHGTPLTMSLRLVREDTGAGIPGATLDLYGHKRGDPDVLLQHVTTGSDGTVVVRRVPSAETRYTFRYAGSQPLLGAAATTVVQVGYRVTAAFSRTPVARGGRATVTLRVSPAAPGLTVAADQHVGARFLGTKRVRLGPSSSAVVPLRTDVSGRQTLYVLTAEGDRVRSGFLKTGFTVR